MDESSITHNYGYGNLFDIKPLTISDTVTNFIPKTRKDGRNAEQNNLYFHKKIVGYVQKM